MTYLRGCCAAARLASSVPRVVLPLEEDWRLDAAGGASDPEMVQNAWANIERDGWTIVGSFTRSFLYSAGLTARGWPELVVRMRAGVTPETPEVAGAVLCEVVRECEMARRAPLAGDQLSVCGIELRLTAIEDRLLGRICTVMFSLYGGRSPRALEVSPV